MEGTYTQKQLEIPFSDEEHIGFRIEDAIDYLSLRFGIKFKTKDRRKLNPEISITSLGKALGGRALGQFCYNEILRTNIIKIDPELFQYNNLFLTDLLIGEEVSHMLHRYSNPAFYELYKRSDIKFRPALDFLIETVGHYGGLIYCNRNEGNIACLLGLLADDEFIDSAYTMADMLYMEHGDKRLREVSKIKDAFSIWEFSQELPRAEDLRNSVVEKRIQS